MHKSTHTQKLNTPYKKYGIWTSSRGTSIKYSSEKMRPDFEQQLHCLGERVSSKMWNERAFPEQDYS